MLVEVSNSSADDPVGRVLASVRDQRVEPALPDDTYEHRGASFGHNRNMQSRYTASTVIDAPMDRIFQLLAEPSQHHRFDSSGMVGAPETPHRLASVGQLFVMNMTYRSGDHVEHYQSDNHVTALDRPRVIEWATATREGPLLGWSWRYEFEPVDGGTGVSLTYDWSAAPQENIDRFGVPLVDEAGLRASLALLTKASTSPL